MAASEENGVLSGNGIELFLDTQGACFLCLKSPSGGADDSSSVEEERLKDVSLREICRFLEISGLKKGRCHQRSRGKSGGGGSQEQYDFAVALCDKCSTCTNRLSELVREWEEIQNVIAHYLQKVHGILKGSQEGDECKQQLEKIRELNPVEVRLVEYLREETSNKCSRKLDTLTAMLNSIEGAPPTPVRNPPSSVSSNSTFLSNEVKPPVRETENSVEVAADAVAPSSSSSYPTLTSSPAPKTSPWSGPTIVATSTANPTAEASTPFEITPATPTTLASSESNTSDSSHEMHLIPIPTVEESFKKDTPEIFSQNYRSMLKNGVKQFHCHHCNFVAYTEASEIRKHFVTNHPEALFKKIPRLPEQMFRSCVSELLASETKTNTKYITKASKQGRKICESYDCKTCSRKYKKEIDFIHHNVLEHYSILEKKLKSLQKASRIKMEGAQETEEQQKAVHLSNQEAISSPASGATGGAQFKCKVLKGGCGKSFSKLKSLRMHERICQKKGTGGWECAQADGGCGKCFASKAGRDRHRRHHCAATSLKNTSVKRSTRMSAVHHASSEDEEGVQKISVQDGGTIEGGDCTITNELEEKGFVKSELIPCEDDEEEDMEDDADNLGMMTVYESS